MVADKLDFVALSPSDRDQFDQNGFLVVPGVLDSITISQLIEAGDCLMSSDCQWNRETMEDGWDSFRNVIATDHIFFHLLTHPKTFPLIVQILGPNIHLLSSQLIYLEAWTPGKERQIRTPDRPGWHRDIYGVPADLGHAHIPRLAIKCAFYLTDVSSEKSGMTLFSPGSHRLKSNLTISSGAIDPENVTLLTLQPGDAVFFENRTFHSGGINKSDFTRKCIMFQYGFRWLKPVDYSQQPQSLIEKCNDIQKQLLGAKPDRNHKGQIVMGLGAQPLRQWCTKHNIIYEPVSF